MRSRNSAGPLSVHAIAGSYVVLLGLDLARRSTRGLLGFAIERWDPKERERYWLRGMKVFEETSKGVPPATPVSLLEHPVQSFHKKSQESRSFTAGGNALCGVAALWRREFSRGVSGW